MMCMKICVYEWALHRIGGGQKVFMKMAECLSREHDVDILTLFKVERQWIEREYSVKLPNVNIRSLFEERDTKRESYLHTISAAKVSSISAEYDLFINSNHETVKPRSKKSIIYFHFPELKRYRKARNIFDAFLLLGYAILKSFYGNHTKDYGITICNSNYTKKWLRRLWKIDSIVLNPPIDTKKIPRKRQNIILSAGRIAQDKNYSFMIICFKEVFGKHKDYQYIICGEGEKSIITEDIANFPIKLVGGLDNRDLQEIYAKSKIFFHAKGYSKNEIREPQEFEHFGMATAEAMAQGCVPIVFNGGGQMEIVEHGESGFLFNNGKEAVGYINRIIENENLRKKLSKNAEKRAERFSTENFQKKIINLVNKLSS